MNDLRISTLQTTLPETELIAPPAPRLPSPSFGELVKRTLANVNRQMVDADEAIENLATGRNSDIHATMIAMQKAEISFELVMQIRNKLIAAYDEIRRMPI